MFCAKCGAKIEDNARFCNKCGSPVPAPQGSGQKGGPAGGSRQGKAVSKKKGFLAAAAVILVLTAVAVGVFVVRNSGSVGKAVYAGGSESPVKEEADEIEEQYASGIEDEGQSDIQEENVDDTGDNAASARETILGQYREFLFGSLTAEYNGNQVTFQELYKIYCEDESITEEYRSASPTGSFALIDSDTDKLPELLINPSPNEMAYAGMCGWRLYTLYLSDEGLKITESANGGYMDTFVLYTNSLLWISHGLSVDQVDWFDTLQGGHVACFVNCMMGSDMENWNSIAEDERRRWQEAGYEQVYVTCNGDTSGVEYTTESFAAEYGGKEVQFYSQEEILNMLPAPDTSTEPAVEAAASPWLIKMKNCTIDVDLSACVPAEYLKAVQRDTYGEVLQRMVSSIYRHPEMLTITQANFFEYSPNTWVITYSIDNSDCQFWFYSEDGGNSWKAASYLNNAKGSDYTGFTIIFDNGVPDNASDLYESCIWTDEFPDDFRENKIYRTDYVMGDLYLNLRDAEGGSFGIPVQ